MSIQFQDKLRFHILGIPHTITGPDWSVCPFTTKVWKFAKMMKQKGHFIVHYGHEDSIVDCDEHVTLITNDDFKAAYGEYNWKEKGLYHYQRNNDLCHIKFNHLAIPAIEKRLQKGDFVLCFWGKGHQTVGEYIHKDKRAIVVEPGVGYDLNMSFAHFKIFESYASMHKFIGLESSKTLPSWYNSVIPLVCDTSQFIVSETRDDYFLHLGRIDKCKGLDIAIRACNYLGVKLKVAGTPSDGLEKLGVDITSNIEYVGCAGIEERKQLMTKAKGFLQLSVYMEPFGCAVIESMLSGCPVITSDWGGFTETVVHGKTGYRVRNFDQLIWAMKNIDKIDGKICREWAEKNYSEDKIAPMFEEYFYSLRLNLFHENEWWADMNNRNELDWLNRDYSMLDKKTVMMDHKKLVRLENIKLDNKIIMDKKNITLTLFVTTCKRFHCFENTINSLLNVCSDIDVINEIVIIDDNSILTDRLHMKVFISSKFNKNTKLRIIQHNGGQCSSINFLFKQIKIENKFLFFLEDDWTFTNKFSIQDTVKHMVSNDDITQIQFTDLYSSLRYYKYEDTDLVYYNFNINSPEFPKTNMYYLKNNNLLLGLHDKCKEQNYGYIDNISNDYWWPGFKFTPSIVNFSQLSNICSNNDMDIKSIDYAELHFSSVVALNDSVILHNPIGVINDKINVSAYVLNNRLREFESSNPTIVTILTSIKQMDNLKILALKNNPIIIYGDESMKSEILELLSINTRITFKEINPDSLKHFDLYNNYPLELVTEIFFNIYWLFLSSEKNYFKSKEIYWISLEIDMKNLPKQFNDINNGLINIQSRSIDKHEYSYVGEHGKNRFNNWFTGTIIGGEREKLYNLLIEYFRYANKMISDQDITFEKILNVFCNKYASKINCI